MNQNNQQAAAAAEQEKPATSAAQQAVNSEIRTSAATAASAAAEQSAEIADKKPAKADKPKQDSAAPRLVPFQMISQLNRSRLSAVGKADDKTLGQLLDAWEKSRDLAENADTSTGKLLNQIRQLKQTNSAFEQTIAELKQQISAKNQELAAANAAASAAQADSNAAERIQLLQTEITAQKQKIAEKEQETADLNSKITEQGRMLKELDKQTRQQPPELKELQNRLGAAEEELKENRKILNGRAEQVAAYEQKVSALEQTIADLKHKNSDLHQQLDAAGAGHYSAPDEFLSAFEPIVAELLQRTADKMTDIRTDGLKVLPSMIVGDMFLKYTLQKRTMWFYKWILSDAEILEIAQNINPNITSIRMLRKILNVDKELN